MEAAAKSRLRIPPDLRRFDLEELQQLIYNGHARMHNGILVPEVMGGSRQYWQEVMAWAVNNGTAVANTVTETIIFPDITIPGGYMQDGRALAARVMGQHSTLGSGTVTLTFRFKWGGVSGTLICGTGAIVTLISAAAWMWAIDVELQTKLNGATGTIEANGEVKVWSGTVPTVGSATGAPAVSPMTAGGQTTPAAVTLDLTSDTALSVTVQHGAASASNTLTGRQYTLKSLN
jgi:hypothetical protein